MRERSRDVGVAFCCVCLVLMPSVESLTWTAQPSNQMEAIKGHHVSFTWRYSLTADELTKSNTYLLISWSKFNTSRSTYDQFAFRSRVLNQAATYFEPNAPRIVIDRATGTNFASLEINNVRLEDGGSYKIEISVEFPGTVIAAHDVVNLTVSVPPEIVFVSTDTDICEGSNVTLSCIATGVPPPSITWTRVADDGKDGGALPTVDGHYVMNNVSRSANGTYRCTASNPAGTVNRTVQVVIRYSPSVDGITNSSNPVTEGGSFHMTCEASGGPENYTWIRIDSGKQVSNEAVLIFNNINRNDSGQYRCEAKNRCGNGSMMQSVDVYYPPTINTYIPSTLEKNDTEEVNLPCEADSNPPAQITWIRLSNNAVVPMPFNISGKQDEGYYNCTANNGVGSTDTRRVFISVLNYRPFRASLVTAKNPVDLNETFSLNCSADAQPTAKYRLYREEDSLINTTVGDSFVTHLTTANKRKREMIFRCTPFNEYGDGPTKIITVIVHYRPFATNTSETKRTTSGNFITLLCPLDGFPAPNITWYEGNDTSGRERFNGKNWTFRPQSSDAGWYICFGENDLGNASASFRLIVGEEPTVTATSPSGSGGPDCEESFFKDTSCSIKLEVAVGISVAAVGLIFMTAAAVGYWIHKKRKCRKDTRIAHEPGCEEQRLQGDDPYAQVNNGYAETGPRSVNSREKGAAAVPDYAVVDKSAKKKKKKQDEEKPPEYAVVDKSKKKKKNEKGDDTYAKVDMSKKTSKKKPRPGEDMLYADLGDFSGASQMPTVATSPKAQAQLPPIKRPEPYEGTQYADITQFFKGDATLPIDDKQVSKQGTELKEKDEKTDGTGGENAPKETPM